MQKTSEEEKTEQLKNILKANKLKVTQPRIKVLEILSRSDVAVSQPDLEKIIGSETDRVTLYRILGSFEEKGILHKIFDLHGTATYALCSPECTAESHHDQHIHFICSTCNSVICLDEIQAPSIDLPLGFRLQSVSINAVGTCANCNEK